MERLVVLAGHRKIAWSLRDKEDEEREETGGHALAAEHQAPARGDAPVAVTCKLGHVDNLVEALGEGLHLRRDVVAEDHEVHEIDDQLAEDDGKLVPTHQSAP